MRYIAFILIALFAAPVWAGPQGTHANVNGLNFENRIEAVLEGKGFFAISHAKWKKDKATFGKELLLKNVPYTNIYGQPGRTEFVLRSERHDLNIRIEAKFQHVSGSTDTKLPYLYHNALEAVPEDRVIVVIGGDGWRPGAVQWLRDAAAQKWYAGPAHSNKTIDVMNFAEFESWVERTFP